MWPFAIALATLVAIGLWIALPVDDLVADVALAYAGAALPGGIAPVGLGGRPELVETVVVAAILGGLVAGIGLGLRLAAGWNRGGRLARALAEAHALRDLRPLALGVVAALAVALGVSVAVGARPAPIVAQCFVLVGLAMLLVPRSEVADPGVVVTSLPFRRPPEAEARTGLGAGAVRVGTDALEAGALPAAEAPALGWTCPRCGLRQDAWSLRCTVDGRLRLPSTAGRPDAERPAASRLPVAARAGERVLVGAAAGAPAETTWERSPFRPARVAAIVAALWLIAPLAWAVAWATTLAATLGLLVAIAVLPILLAYLLLVVGTRWRDRWGVPGPSELLERAVLPAAQWVRDAFPHEPPRPPAPAPPTADDAEPREPPAGEERPAWRSGRRVEAITLTTPTYPRVRVEMREPGYGWPPPGEPAILRVVGTWIDEPDRFDARTIETVDAAGRIVRPAIRARRPLGALWAALILLAPAIITGLWLVNAVLPLLRR